MKTVNDFRKSFQEQEIYLNDKEDLKFLINNYIKTYCAEQDLPQISVKFIDFKNTSEIGFCAAEENLIVFNESILNVFEESRQIGAYNMNLPYTFMDCIEHELDHFKQYLNLYNDKEKLSYERPLNGDGYHLTEHEKKTYLRTFNLLENISKENSNEDFKNFVTRRKSDFLMNTDKEKEVLNYWYKPENLEKLITDMQEDISFATILYKNKQLKGLGINARNTTNIFYETQLDGKNFTYEAFEGKDFLVGTISFNNSTEKNFVEFGIKDGTLHVFDLYNEDTDGVHFNNTLSEKSLLFFKENELYKILNSVIKEYENKENIKINNIRFNKYMNTYDNSLHDKIIKQIKSLKSINGDKINIKEDKDFHERIHKLNAQKYFENLVKEIKNTKTGDVRNSILPEEINIKDFNYYAETFLGEVFPKTKIEKFYYNVLDDNALNRNISANNIKTCFNKGLNDNIKENLSKLIEKSRLEKESECEPKKKSVLEKDEER